MFWKCSKNIFSMIVGSCSQWFDWFLILWIVFLCLLMVEVMWTNFVFRLALVSYWRLDFCFQSISSLFIRSFRQFIKLDSRVREESEGACFRTLISCWFRSFIQIECDQSDACSKILRLF